jgi:integrase
MSTKVSVKNDWEIACDGVLNRLALMGYSKGTINCYSCFYKSFISFLIQRKLIDKPVDKKYTDAFLKFFDDPYYHIFTSRFYVCSLRRLLEFHQKGSFDYRKKKLPVPLPDRYESILAEYKEYRTTENGNTTERTERGYISIIRDFLHCLHGHRVTSLHRICFNDVHAFFKKNPKLSPCRISCMTGVMRSFFRFLIGVKKCSPKLLGFIPRVRYANAFRLAAIWPQDSVKKLLSVIDRKTGLGKRDYAITLLVSKLGLRIGDVLNLQIENVDWRRATIKITQQKTKNFLELPMSEEIGNALIDYLTNGRPSTPSHHFFIMHRAPYSGYSPENCLSYIISKYRKKAGIVLHEAARQGWHSLRHSLATRLHEESTPLPVIASILGHASVETTRIYAKTNIEMLRSAALEWEEF